MSETFDPARASPCSSPLKRDGAVREKRVPRANDGRSKHLVSTVLNIWSDSCRRGSLIVGSNSMWPLIQVGSKIWVIFGTSTPKFGDIVLYRRHGQLVVHRVVGKRGDGFLTKGDRALEMDVSPVGRQRIVAKVIGVERRGKFLNLESIPWQFVNRGLAVCSLVVATVGGIIRGREKSTGRRP